MGKEGKKRFHILLLAGMVLIFYSVFSHPFIYDNEASRLDLAWSIALRHTLNIDAYHSNTIDKAFFRGHYYCDKAPGLSFAAAPLIAAGRALFPDACRHPENRRARYFLILMLVAIPSALSLLMIVKMIEYLSGENNLFPVCAFALGTLAFPYSTLFYDHQFSAVLLVASFYLWFQWETNGRKPGAAPAAIAGAFAGYASISEYPAAVPAIFLIAFWFFSSKNRTQRICLALGMLAPFILLAAYNTAAFGHPLRIGYLFESNTWFRTEMNRGIGGVTYPKLSVLARLLFAPHRGLFWGQPFLLLAVPGAVALWRPGGIPRRICIMASLFVLFRIFINASYYEPYGGYSPGPRFLVGALPFLAVLSAAAWSNLRGAAKSIVGGAGLFSIVCFFLINAVEPHVPHVFTSPLLQFTIPLMASGYGAGSLVFQSRIFMFVPCILIFAGGIYFLIKDSYGIGLLTTVAGAAVGFLFMAVLMMATAFPISPAPAETAYYMGTTFNRAHQHEKAAEQFSFSLYERPGFAPAWYGLGIAEYKTGNYNEAVQSFKRALELNPGDIQTRITLIAALLSTGDIESAGSELETGLAARPENRELLNLKRLIENLTRTK